MESEESVLQKMASLNRQSYQLKALDKADSEDEQQHGAEIASYSSSNGLMQLTDATGSSFYASSLTNGATGKGETVRLRRGGASPTYDSMPFVKRTQNALLQNPKYLDTAILYAVPEMLDENSAPPYINGGWSFSNGRCRNSRGLGYASLEQCQLFNSMIGLCSPGSGWPYLVSNISKTINSVHYSASNREFVSSSDYDYFLVTVSGLFSSYPSSIRIKSTLEYNHNGIAFDKIVAIGLNKNTWFNFDQDYHLVPVNYDYLFDDANFETTINLQAGGNYISFLWRYDTEQNSGENINAITVDSLFEIDWKYQPEPVQVNRFYIRTQRQSKEQDIKLLDLRSDETYKAYVSKTTTDTYVNFKAGSSASDNYPVLKRFVIPNNSSPQLTTFQYPQSIPDNVLDWQNSITNNYNQAEALGSFGACIPTEIGTKEFNYYQNTLYQCDLSQVVSGQLFSDAVKTLNMSCIVQTLSPRVDGASCIQGAIKQSNILVNSIGENSEIVAVSPLLK